MLWGEDIPRIAPSPGVEVEVMAGAIESNRPPSPPPDSWGSRNDSHLAIWHITLEPGARWQMPLAPTGVNRMLHCCPRQRCADWLHTLGEKVGGQASSRHARQPSRTTAARPTFLLLQGQPIGAPVFQLGPFVMNSAEEFRQAVDDYRRTQFGGWPWSRRDPVHPRTEGRFAIHADGRVEHRDMIPTG